MKFHFNLWIKEFLLFGLTQALGLVVAETYVLNWSAGGQWPAVTENFSASDFGLAAVILGLLIWALVKPSKANRWLFRVFLVLAVWGGSLIVLSSFLRPFVALLVSAGLIIWWLTRRRVFSHNLMILLALAGLGAVLGLSLNPLLAVGILLVFSFYDVAAVYFTKHMIKMAESMMSAGAVFGFVIPFHWRGFKAKTKEAKPGQDFMILGSGDVALPLLLSASLARFSLVQAWLVAAFALLGLWLTHILFLNQKERRPMAALPPIALMSIVGYLVGLVFGF